MKIRSSAAFEGGERCSHIELVGNGKLPLSVGHFAFPAYADHNLACEVDAHAWSRVLAPEAEIKLVELSEGALDSGHSRPRDGGSIERLLGLSQPVDDA